MGRRIVDALWDRGNLKDINDNFKELFDDQLMATELKTFAQNILNQANKVNSENGKVQEQLNQIVLDSNNANAEVAQARGSFKLLNERLDAMNKASERGTSTQPDFVDKLNRLVNFDEIQVKKVSDNAFTVSNFNKAAKRHVTNVFQKNANDDYIILSESYVGSTTVSELNKDFVNYSKVSGTIDTTYATHYTTEIGTKIKANITGTEIYMRRFGDNRGGMWEFVIDGDTSNKIKVTNYKATSGTDDFKIIGGLEDKTHLIEGTFIGADPSNSPTGGTARGWLSYADANGVGRTFFSRFTNENMTRENTLNAAMSNKDFALRIKPSGYSGDYHFVPEHNAVGTAFKINNTQFLLDGKPLDIFNLQVGVSSKGKKFTLIQSMYGRYPLTNENLLRIDNVHEISLNSSIRLIGKVTVLKNIDIQDGYFLMLPVTTETASRLKTSRFNDYNTQITDGSQTKLAVEKDDTTSFIFTSATNTNLFSSLVVNDPERSIRSGGDGKFPEGQTAWIEHRNASMQKLYQSIYRLSSIKAGTNLYYDGIYLSGEIPNVHNLF
ncbi:hypothetical protein [Staphylococcus haemolyticus]|uniref:hypothetical protein n=1 Tax=Staphylococcus haemolyticus TaxID=1283 RepID=UPI00069FB554|nr:hypothetical protein [Staphylococcus haemolyticus]